MSKNEYAVFLICKVFDNIILKGRLMAIKVCDDYEPIMEYEILMDVLLRLLYDH